MTLENKMLATTTPIRNALQDTAHNKTVSSLTASLGYSFQEEPACGALVIGAAFSVLLSMLSSLFF